MPSGSLVAGRYRVGQLLGQGGMGLVHVAWDTILERRVALKTLRGGAARRDENVARFRAEARNAASLSHPNIVKVFDAGDYAGVPYIAMELVVGDTLAEAIDVHGPLPPGSAISLALEAAEALTEAHDNGIVHRDIKPQNILVDDQGRARVVDFGIAAPLDHPGDERASTVEGTAAYLSPEQISGMAASPRSDLYSLGAVLYEMLSGYRAFGDSESDDLAVARMHLTEHPVPPRVYAPWLPPELEALVLRLLSKEPEERCPSARALARELEALLWSITSASDLAPTPANALAASTSTRTVAKRTGRLALLTLLTGLTMAIGFVALASVYPVYVPDFVPVRVIDTAEKVSQVSSATLLRVQDRAGEYVGNITKSASGIFSDSADATQKTVPVTEPTTKEHDVEAETPPETTGSSGSPQGFSKPEAPPKDAVEGRDLSPRQTFNAGPAKQTP